MNKSVCGPATASLMRAALRLARMYRKTQPRLSASFLRDVARYREELLHGSV